MNNFEMQRSGNSPDVRHIAGNINTRADLFSINGSQDYRPENHEDYRQSKDIAFDLFNDQWDEV